MNSEKYISNNDILYNMREEIPRILKENIDLAKKGKFRKREIYLKAVKLLSIKQILSIVGVRRCGKSTLMKELIRIALKETDERNIFYLNLEHPFFNQYKENVNNLQKIYNIFKESINPKKKVFLFLDEIQFFNDWQIFIKNVYEKENVKIVLTGSNSRLLSSELATLLSGRTIPLHVYPFSLKESKLNFQEYLVDGGFPDIVLDRANKKILAETYYKNILYQDVIPRFGIKNSLAIENLSYYLISNIGKEISYNTLKSISHLDDKTAKQYISYLENANLLYVIHNYDFSLKKLIGNKKKIYLVDPIFTQLSFKNSPDLGRLFENFVYMFFKRHNKNIYFHQNGGECDFIIKEGISITNAFQVCYNLNEQNKEREIKGLLSAMEKFKLPEGHIITYNKNKSLKIDNKNIYILDINSFIKKFGMNSEK